MNIEDDIGPEPEGLHAEAIGRLFAEHLDLIDETIKARVTDDDIKFSIRRAMARFASGPHGRSEPDSPDRSTSAALLALLHEPERGPVVLAGPGGAGKTTAARKLARHAEELAHQVIWVSAVDPVTLVRDLMAAAQLLGGTAQDVDAIARGGTDAADRFWRLLENAGSEWLLVFDEADDPAVLAFVGNFAPGVQDLTGWVRASARGLVLVTTRETSRRTWAAAQFLTVAALEESAAAELLRQFAPAAGDDDQARTLARRLNRHPLNLRLAGRYLRSEADRGATFATYVRAFDEPGSHRSAEILTARAVELSLERLVRRGARQARAVLQLASCYGPGPVPAALFESGHLAGKLSLPDGAPSETQSGIDTALRELGELGLFEPGTGHIALHTAVTEAGRASLNDSDPAAILIRHTAVELLADRAAQLSIDEPDTWPEFMVLGTHLLSLLDTTADRVDREHLELLFQATARVANALNQGKAGQAAVVLCQRALAHAAALGDHHRTVLRVRHQQAWWMVDAGHIDEAEALYQDVFRLRLSTLHADDPDLVDSRHELAWIAACRQNWPRAEQGYRDALQECARILRKDDDTESQFRLRYQMMLTQHELGWVIANQDDRRLDEARDLFRGVLADRRRLLGDAHPRTLTTQHELAWIAARKAQWAQAEAAYRALLTLRLRVLGGDHPDTLLTRKELAWVEYRGSRNEIAERHYLEVLDDCRRILGEDHPQTRMVRGEMDKVRRGETFDAHHIV